MKVRKEIDIYLVQKRNVKVIDVVQYDKGIQLVFNVKDFEIPSGTSATLYVQKPSGKFVYQEDEITIEGNAITIDLENQAIAEDGKVSYQVSLTNGSDDITTFEGVMMVQKSLKDAGAIKSSTVIRAFNEAVDERVAEFKARAEQIATNIIATIPEDYQVMEAKVNQLANAIKGNLSGAVVFVDDVSPVEHNPSVKVHGKNLLNPVGESKTQNGVTFTNNGNGTFSVKGTSTTPTTFDLTNLVDYPIHLKKGKTYTQSVEIIEGEGASHHIVPSVVDDSGTVIYNYFNGNETQTADKDYKINSYSFYIGTNVTVNFTFRVQLEEGSVATDYEPYIDTSTVKVRRCGKNVFEVTATTRTINGVTCTVNENGSVTVNGTATKDTFIGLGNFCPIVGEKYHLSGSPDGSGFDTHMLFIHNNTTGADIYDLGNGKTFSGNSGEQGLSIAMYDGNTANNLVFYPMIVCGEEGGDFEKYNGTEHTPSSDGTVEGITSLSPNMTILTDTEGVIVECEYNKDTNKVVHKLADALGITI